MHLIGFAVLSGTGDGWFGAAAVIAAGGVVLVAAVLYAIVGELRRLRSQGENLAKEAQRLAQQSEKVVREITETRAAGTDIAKQLLRDIAEFKTIGARASDILGHVGVQNALSVSIAQMAASTVESAKTAAAAAERSALASVNAERGWMLADLAWQERAKLTDTVTAGTPSTVANVRLLYSNRGKTPCVVTEIVARFEIRDAIDPEPDLSFGIVRNMPEAVPVGDKPRELALELQAGKRRIYAGNKGLMVIYGTMRYRDVFNETRETRFGYAIDSSTFTLERIVGFPEYNKHV